MNDSSYNTLGRSPHQIIRDGSFATKRQFIHNQLFHHHIVQHNIVIQALLKKLHASFIHQKVPDFYGYFFMGQLTLCSQQRICDCINRQIQLLKAKKSHYHLIMRHIDIRQSCLKSINLCLESLFDQVKPSLLDKFGEQIKHLRQLTVWVMQSIKEWKNSLFLMSPNVFQDQHISFFYQGEDYLLKILKDTDFIAKSFLAEKVNFSYKQDPFIMRPCTNDTQNNEFSALFKFSPQEQQKYIGCLQFLAEERADYIKRKIMAKTDKIKQIERVYQARQFNQKIMITKPIPIALRKAKLSINDAPIDFIDETSKEQQAKRTYRSSSLSNLRDNKSKQIQVKQEKMKKIKQMEFGSSSPLINIKKFNSLQNSNLNLLPINRSISLSFLKKMSFKNEKLEKQKQIQTDFQSMVRKKELQVLDNDSTKKRTLSSIKLKDRLSQRKLVDSKEGAQQLRKILDQIQHSSPQKQQHLLARREAPSHSGRNLLQQNQQIMISLRQTILKEIADDTAVKQKAEQQKRQQNQIMQKLIKKKLDQETLVDIQKEKAKWTLGKDVLAHEINKKELFDLHQSAPNKSQKINQLQEELKRQMQLKFLRQVHEELSHRQAVFKQQKQRKKQQRQRQKQLEVVIRKQQQENRFKEIESEERGKAMQKVLYQQQRKKKQIESEMQAVIQKQQERLIIFSNEQKMKLEADLRENMKQKLLINLKKQKSVLASEREAQEKHRLLQEANRAQIRKKMEQQFQVEKHMERQRQREEKTRKLRLVAQKMNHLTQEQEHSMLIRQQTLKQQKIEELKQNITNFPLPTKGQEENKRKLREQFQLELFAFNRPQMFNKLEDNFVIKDFKAQIDNDQNLNKKFSEASQVISQKEQTEIIQKQSSLKASKIQQSFISDNFVRFSQADKQSIKQEINYNQQQLHAKGIDMTPAEYTIYLKKKQAINAKRITPKPAVDIDKVINMLDKFQKMSNLDSEKQQSVYIEKQISEKPSSIKIKPAINVQLKAEVDQSPKKSAKKPRQQQSEDLSQVMKLTVHSKMGSMHKKKFVTSDEDDGQLQTKRIKKESARKSSNKKKVRQSSSEQQPQNFEKFIHKIQTAYFKNVPWENIDNYLTVHIKKMPKVLRRLNLLRKDELLKSLEDYKNVIIVEVGNPQQPEGIVFIVQNENKPNIRSLNIIYFGSYRTDDTLNVLIKTRDLLFNSDPCSQITFSMYYNKNDEEQQTFVRQFEKNFDQYGAIFQKKISNDQTQRKHILRRMIGQSSKPLAKTKAIGQLKIQQAFISHPVQLSLGVQLGLEITGSKIGGWTLLGLFLSEYGKQQQIVQELTSDVVEQSKNMKLLSKMAMKLKNNRYADIQFEKFQSPFQANLKFVEFGAQLIKCYPKVQQDLIPITVMRSTITMNPVLPFLSTTSNFYYRQIERTGKYLRFRCGKGSKVLKLKSSLYSSVVTVIPCKPNNYKILLTDALQFDAISKKTPVDLYIKLFLANITQHSQSNDQNIWIPQFTAQGNYQPEYGRQFGFNSQMRNKVELAYTEYVPNCITFKPSHRDLFITPPFIVAVLNSDIEKSSEGSPIYLQRIDLQDLVAVVDVPIPAPQSDF